MVLSVQSPTLRKVKQPLTASCDIPGEYYCEATFTIRGDLADGQHVRLIGKSSVGWDFVNGWNLASDGGDGADVAVWTATIPIPLKSRFEYSYVATDGTSFVHLTRAHRFTPKELSIQVNDGNFTSLLNHRLPPSAAPHSVWVATSNHFRLVLGFSDVYVLKPGQPSVGYDISSDKPVDSVRVYVQTGSSLHSEQTISRADIHAPINFRVQALSKTTAVYFDFLAADGSLIGKAASLASALTATAQGISTSPVVDTAAFTVIGSVSFQYTYTSPFVHPSMVAETSQQIERKSPFTSQHVLVGHRGSGSSVSQSNVVDGYIRSHIKENTLFSFSQAGVRGANYVEFDVQLTSDMVPIIYHDFAVHLDGKPAYPIHSLTLEEFQQLGGRSPSSESPASPFLDLLPPLPSKRQPLFDNFPTLQETLTKVPKNIGFNVEIKYPIRDEVEKHNVHPIERNAYIDRILWDIFEFAGDRDIVFSSFDPDICLMLMHKQPNYPVMFLTQLGSHLRSDPRCNSPAAGIDFAKSCGLAGLVCPAAFLLANPEVIPLVRKSGLMLGSWGILNNDPESVRKQLDLGLNAAIVDHVAHIAKHWEKMVLSAAAAVSAVAAVSAATVAAGALAVGVTANGVHI